MDYDWTQDANCVGAWLFTEGSGTTVADSSTNSNTGTFESSGHPAWSSTVPAVYEPYSALFASGDTVDMGSGTPSPGTGDFSVSTWVRSAEVNTFSLSTRSGSAAQGYEFLIGSGGVAGAWTFREGGSTTSANTAVKTGLNDSAFHHLVGTIDYDGNDYFFVDGVDAGGAISTSIGSITNSQNLYLAKRGTTETFTGYVGETAIFNAILDSTDINDIMDNGLLQSASTPTYRRRMLMGVGQ